MRTLKVFATACLVLTVCALQRQATLSENPAANIWVKQEKAMIGPDVPVAVVWSPKIKRFMSLGWISSAYDRRAPYTYDELAFDPASGQWENWYLPGKEWGPRFGVCKPPGWKGRVRFKDAEGNVRPNWPDYYWLLGAAANCTYLPEDGTFLFYVNGSTFNYDPVHRTWQDLAPVSDPQNSTRLKTQLFWGSICYDQAREQVILFGGGNADTERGDPGTWVYTPRANTWRELKPKRQPPQRANSPMVYDPVNKKIILFGGDQLDHLLVPLGETARPASLAQESSEISGRTHGSFVMRFFARQHWDQSGALEGDRLLDQDLSPGLCYKRPEMSNGRMGPCTLIAPPSNLERVGVEYARWVNRCASWICRRGKMVHDWRSPSAVIPNPRSLLNTVYAFPSALKLLESGKHSFAIL